MEKKKVKLFKINDENVLELVKNNISTKDSDITLTLEKGDLYVIGIEKNMSSGYEKIVIFQTIFIVLILLALIYFMIKCSRLKSKSKEIS